MKELLDTGVHISLEYYESDDALIGAVKGFSAAVRENLSTGSYGVLMWVKPGGASGTLEVRQYLSEQQGKNANLIKNFVVTELGAAIALNRRGDAFTDINALKHFLYELADFFAANGFVNCCCKCGSDADLGIYAADNVITQTCASCAGGYRPIIPSVSALAGAAPFRPIPKMPASPVKEEPAVKEEAPAAEGTTASAAELPPQDDMTEYLEGLRAKSRALEEAAAAAIKEAQADLKEAESEVDESLLVQVEASAEPEIDESLLVQTEAPAEPEIDESLLVQTETAPEPETEEPLPARNEPDPEMDDLMFAEPEPAPEAPKPQEEKPQKEKKNRPQNSIRAFMESHASSFAGDSLPTMDATGFAGTSPAPEAPAPKKAPANTGGNKGAAYDDIFDNFMFNDEEEEEKPAPKSELFEQIEREYAEEQAALAEETGEENEDDGLDDLLFDSMMDAPEEVTQDVIREEKQEQEKEKVPDIAFTELLINEGGEIEVKEAEKEIDDGTVVTETYDDSNDGEDIDVTEITSTVSDPTITTGGVQLTAEDTPLELDGSVPLVNPKANRESKQVSSADGPDAVTALEEQMNRYSQTVPDEPFAKGFATAENMIDRDAPVVYSDRKRKKFDHAPEFDLKNEYALRQGHAATSGYTSFTRSVSHIYSRPFRGLLGALLIGLVGVAVWLVFGYFMQEISWMGAFAAVIAPFLGYFLIGGAQDKKGIIISLFVALLLTFAGSAATTFLSFRVDIMNAVGENGSIQDILTFFITAVQAQTKLRAEFLRNMVYSYAVSGVTSMVTVAILWRRTF